MKSAFSALLLHILLPSLATGQTAGPPSDSLRAVALIAESKKYSGDGDHATALEKARQGYDVLAAAYGPDHLASADAAMYVARELRYLYRPAEAYTLNMHSLAVFEARRDTPRIARCRQNIGLALREQRRHADAYREMQRAIDLLARDSARHASYIAEMRTMLGSILNADKNYRAALPPLESARSVFVAQQNYRSAGFVDYHLGTAWLRLHDVERAREQFVAALAHLQGQLSPTHSHFADLYVKIALCCQQLDEADAGLEYMARARAVYLHEGPQSANYIDFLQNFGLFYLREKRFADAIEQLEACRALRAAAPQPDPYILASTLELLGQAYLGAGRYGAAEAAFRDGMPLLRDSLPAFRRQLFQFYGYLAEARLQQGDFAAGLRLGDTAFAVAGFDPARWEAMLPRDLGRELCQRHGRALLLACRQTGDTVLLARADYYLGVAVRILEREIEEISVNSSREVYYDRDYTVFEQWLDVRMAQFHRTGTTAAAEAAFGAATEGKAFLLKQSVGQHAALQHSGIPDSTLQALYELRDQITAAEKVVASRTMPDSTALAINRELAGLRAVYDARLARAQAGRPRFAPRRTPTLPELRRALAPDQGLLMYSATPGALQAFVLTRDTLIVRSIPADSLLAASLTQFTAALTGFYTIPAADDALYDRSLDQYVALAQMLYRQLVAPVAASLPGRVVIVPEGRLWYLPFEALLNGAPADVGNFRTYPFWLRTRAISYALAPQLLQPGTAGGLRRRAPKPWLGVAPFARGTGLAVRQAADTTAWPPLPFSGEEIRAIGALVGGDMWLNEDADARADRFRHEAAQYRVLHLASHSRTDERQGHYASIATSRMGAPLQAKDLAQLDLAADLVVLSACETGAGRLRRGEGVIGLVRAFMQAGARAVVASLWVANDQSTAPLMLDFYRGLNRNLPKDRALQQARLMQIDRAPAAAHPFFWAGFRVYGELAN